MIAVRAVVIAIALISSATFAGAAKLKVVASFSILADMASRVGENRIEIHTLVGPNGDAHVFQPTPGDAKAVAQADVILLNGLGFEPWVKRLIHAAAAKGTVVIVSAGVTPRRFGPDAAAAIDPHAWQDLRNGEIYARNIGAAFAAADKASADFYEKNAASYAGEMAVLDGKVRAAFAALPTKRRGVITSHDAFGYFGAAYGIAFVAPLGLSTDDQASAKGVARLIDQIRQQRISAVFVENVTDPRLIAQIARETGVKIGGELFSDALSKPGGAAATYTDMFGHNKSALVAAMTTTP